MQTIQLTQNLSIALDDNIERFWVAWIDNELIVVVDYGGLK
jgi:hypothetical protein